MSKDDKAGGTLRQRMMGLFRAGADAGAEESQRERVLRAHELHKAGDFDAALSLYNGVLEENSGHAEAWYRIGNLQKDRGDWALALQMYDRAIALKPDYLSAFCNRGVVLGLLQRPDEALQSYDRGLAVDASDAITHCNRAMLLVSLGRKDPALDGFKAALQHDPNNFAALFGCGALLQESKDWSASMAFYQRATAVNPADAAALYNHAVVAIELRRWDAALASCESAIKLNPGLSQAYAKRAQIFQERKQYAEALRSYDKALELNPRDDGFLRGRGVLHHLMGDFSAALDDFEQAIALNPSNSEGWFNRGATLGALDDLSAALASYDHALELRPDFVEAYVNRGTALQDHGFIDKAIESYQAAIALDPALPEAHYNLALASLTLGAYEAGWREYEWRWQAKGGPIYRERREFAEPLWLGRDSIAGKTILLYGEQGLGDSLQFVRYVELVAKLGASVILELPAPLVPLFASIKGVAKTVAYSSPLPRFDYQCPLMSLALAFETTLDKIPASAGYLEADPDKTEAWQVRLGARDKPRIGLSWSGNQAAGTNRKRHFSLSRLIPFLPEKFDYFCLQTDVVAADQKTLDDSKIFQFQGLLRDFSDTAALCACMDKVISVDTSVAHLSCGLGKPTAVLLAHAADWRWLLGRRDSPWYRTATLHRQPTAGDWDSVFESVTKDLRLRSFASG